MISADRARQPGAKVTTTTVADLLAQLDTGIYDEMLDDIADIIQARREYVRGKKVQVNKSMMSTGDRVRICGNIRPKYLLGTECVVSGKPANRRGDIMVELPYTVGRFWGTIGVPANCLELV
jgi:hypothetical protein